MPLGIPGAYRTIPRKEVNMSGPTPNQLAYTGAPIAALATVGAVLAAAGAILMRIMMAGANRAAAK